MISNDKMKKSKSSISKAQTYKEIGEFWDTHDLSEYWDKTKGVNFDVNLESEKYYYGLEKSLSVQIESVARKRGVSGDILINLWIQEKLQHEVE